MWTVGTHYNKERIGDFMGIAGYPTQKFRHVLEAKGYKKDRTNGGHEVWEKQVTVSCTIPIHSKEINGKLAMSLAKKHHLSL